MKKEFQIQKEGVTAGKITILSNSAEPFDRKSKIAKYILLGYKVFNMKGKQIK